MLLLKEYSERVCETDQFRADQTLPIVFGLFGEVGGLVATAKKHDREQNAYLGYHERVTEEFGDILWYFNALCKRSKVSSANIFQEAFERTCSRTDVAACSGKAGQVATVGNVGSGTDAGGALRRLAHCANEILRESESTTVCSETLVSFGQAYIIAIGALEIDFEEVAKRNIKKVRGRFLNVLDDLPDFDKKFDEDEQIPKQFEIHIVQKRDGRSYLKWNGVFIGDPLSDNIADGDGFRFHDVFHFAHAAVLHWSPTFRALIKHKRKSAPSVEEAQDSGRAVVVEEGLTAWVFSQAKQLQFFENTNRLSFDLLKGVQQFVRGYEVERCPLSLWESAIIQGYSAFRKIYANGGGVVIGNRESRTINVRVGDEK